MICRLSLALVALVLAHPAIGREDESTTVTRYLEIPLRGRPGDDLLAEGMRDALEQARRKRIKHVVLIIDCPDGFPREVSGMIDAASDHEGDFRFTALVHRAEGSSAALAFCADDVFVARDAQLGGPSAGDPAEVQDIVTRVAVIAEKQGHDPGAARRAVSGVVITADEAVDSGLATGFAGTPEEAGSALGFDGWEAWGRYGEARLKAAVAAREREEKKRQRLVNQTGKQLDKLSGVVDAIVTNTDEAQAADPEKFTYSYYENDGSFTPESQTRWRENTDRAMGAWERVVQLMGAAAKSHREAMKSLKELEEWSVPALYAEAYESDMSTLHEQLESIDPERLGVLLKSHLDHAKKEIARLMKNRHRSHV